MADQPVQTAPAPESTPGSAPEPAIAFRAGAFPVVNGGTAAIAGAVLLAIVLLGAVALTFVRAEPTWRSHTRAAESAFFVENYIKAEEQFTLAVSSARAFGDDDTRYATALRNLASFYFHQGRYDDAEPLITESIRIQETVLGSAHPAVAASLYDMASLYTARERFEAAEPLVERALSITRRTLGPDNSYMADGFDIYANVLEGLGDETQAEAMRARAQAIAVAPVDDDPADSQVAAGGPPVPIEKPLQLAD